jgi:hypothetical protein
MQGAAQGKNYLKNKADLFKMADFTPRLRLHE